MPDTIETIFVSGTKEVVEDIRKQVDEHAGSQIRLTERKNLDGDTSTWIMVANVAMQALPVVLTFIKDYISTKQVKKIKVGDLEIENPTAEDVRTILNSRSK